MPTRPSPRSERLGTPNTPAIRFTRGPFFEASLVRHCYGLSGCSPPWTDLTEFPRPPGAFTSRLPAGRSPFPPLDMTTTATGLLCWRDFHPQEWQLASLHRIDRGLALAPSIVWPSALVTASASGTMGLSRLNGWPARSPADASPLASRPDTHGSGPTWIATPSSYRTLTDYSWPVSRRTTKSR